MLVLMIVAAGALSFVNGCRSAETVSVRLLESDRGEPIAGARVRAVSLDAGELPLPISRATLDELLIDASPRSAFTDAAGEVELKVLPGRPLLVLASPPPFGGYAASEAGWGWSLPSPTRGEPTWWPSPADPNASPGAGVPDPPVTLHRID